MITMAQILAGIDSKITNPAGGTKGQHLITNGSGGVSWSGSASEITGNTLRINGQNYTVRTGTEGEDGYITIAEKAIYLGAKEVSLQLADKAVESIYLGAELVYTKPGKGLTLFDNGYVTGVSWTGNKFPRQGYTAYGRYSFDHVSDGYMQVYISDAGSSYENEHNGHICTSAAVTVPAKASTINISVKKRYSAIKLVFGLLPENAPNSYSTSKGGVLSSAINLSADDYTTYSLTIPDSCKGQALYPIINGRGVANTSREAFINKVWID